jgi:hypothetical protein
MVSISTRYFAENLQRKRTISRSSRSIAVLGRLFKRTQECGPENPHGHLARHDTGEAQWPRGLLPLCDGGAGASPAQPARRRVPQAGEEIRHGGPHTQVIVSRCRTQAGAPVGVPVVLEQKTTIL